MPGVRGIWLAQAAVLFVCGHAAAETETSAPRAPAADQAGVVEVMHGARVYGGPGSHEHESRGHVVKGARLAVLERAPGEGCDGPWLRIGSEAWICSQATTATDGPATSPSLSELAPGEVLPRPYLVTRDVKAYESLEQAVKGTGGETIRGVGGFVRRSATLREGKRFYKTRRGWVAASDVETIAPSRFQGVHLTRTALGKTLAFVRSKHARLYDERGRALGEPRPGRHTFLGEVGAPVRRRGKTFYPVGAGKYLRDKHISLVQAVARPGEVGEGERWIDVSLAQQTLVAYEGDVPVFATLVSTSRGATPPGVYRIEKKRAFGRLRAMPEFRRQWDVHVPWVMTLKDRLAMHVAYWHEEFGRPFSAGCVNLSPLDAKWVWDFTGPALPSGWLSIESSRSEPGTVVRIRE